MRVEVSMPLPGAVRLAARASADGLVRDFSIPLVEPGFPPMHSFTVEVPAAVQGDFVIEVVALDARDLALARGSGSTALAVGKERDITVELMPSLQTPPALDALVPSRGTLMPAFTPEHTEYRIDLPLATASLSFIPTTMVGAVITIDGVTVASGTSSVSRTLALGTSVSRIEVADASATRTYVITVSRGALQSYLKAGNTGAQDEFGAQIALSGDTLAIGAWHEDSAQAGINGAPNDAAIDSGAVYVFVRTPTLGWVQQAFIKASNPQSGDEFGYRVALDGDTLAVSALDEDSGTAGVNRTPDEAAPDSGAVYVFVRNGSTWTQQAYLKASNAEASDHFGSALAVEGDTIVVGAELEDGAGRGVGPPSDEGAANSGAVYVFARSGTTWTEQAYLKSSNSDPLDRFGRSVALSGNTLAVGAVEESSGAGGVNQLPDESAPLSGAVYVFVRAGTTWAQQAYLKAFNPGPGDKFGLSVALVGDTLAVGSPGEAGSGTGALPIADEAAPGSGAVYLFARNGNVWSPEAYVKPSNTGAGDQFGWSIAFDGTTLAVGAPLEDGSASTINGLDDDNLDGNGAVYLFTRAGRTWRQQAYVKSPTRSAQDEFGYSVALSGGTLAVGAVLEDSDTIGPNTVPTEAAYNSGAAFVF